MVFKKGNTPWLKGKKHSAESLQKMREWTPTEETRKKMSNAKKNIFIPWNKGKTQIYSKETLNKIANARKGKKMSEETKEKKRIYMKHNNQFKGKKHSEESLQKMRGRKVSVETRKKLSAARAKQVMPLKDTTIEVKIQNFLKGSNIEFTPHKYMCDIKYSYQCDMFVPVQQGVSQKIVIECDGDYWHGNLEKYSFKNLSQRIKAQRCLDYERTAQLEEAGFTVIRLPEHEIRTMDEDKFKERLLIC